MDYQRDGLGATVVQLLTFLIIQCNGVCEYQGVSPEGPHVYEQFLQIGIQERFSAGNGNTIYMSLIDQSENFRLHFVQGFVLPWDTRFVKASITSLAFELTVGCDFNPSIWIVAFLPGHSVQSACQFFIVDHSNTLL